MQGAGSAASAKAGRASRSHVQTGRGCLRSGRPCAGARGPGGGKRDTCSGLLAVMEPVMPRVHIVKLASLIIPTSSCGCGDSWLWSLPETHCRATAVRAPFGGFAPASPERPSQFLPEPVRCSRPPGRGAHYDPSRKEARDSSCLSLALGGWSD